MAFPTPIVSYLWPDSNGFNAALASEIRGRADRERGVSRSNAGGWHSAADLLTWETDGIMELRERIRRIAGELVTAILTPEARDGARELVIEAWANLAQAGDYHMLHDHPGAHWSGVYYVAAPESVGGRLGAGQLELLDPRLGINMLPLAGSAYTSRMMIDPRPGLMVCFPSWLKHIVHPFDGLGDRISVSFNITIAPKQA